MNDRVEANRSPQLDEVLKLVRIKVNPIRRDQMLAFVDRYLGQVDPEDLADRSPDDLYGAALSHWNFAQKRERGHARVRVFNPTVEEHGWQSTHTVVEIVNDDMPFLVDSVSMEINRHALALHLIVHPILTVMRDAGGTLTGLASAGAAEAVRESFIHVEIDRMSGAAAMDELAADLARVLRDVRAAVTDWEAMRAQVGTLVGEIARDKPPLPADEIAEGSAFLAWLAENNFTFLGYRRHELVTVDGQDALKVVPGSSLGILRATEGQELAASFATLPAAVKAYARRPELLVITKSTSRSTVHRPGYLDYVAVKRFDAQGNVCGEDRFLGLFTSIAYSANPVEIPLLRRKVANIMARSGVAPGSHAAKALANILTNYPRDELFQTVEDELLATALGILRLGDRQRFRLFVRRDAFERFIVCMIYVPRENYSTDLRQKWQAILIQTFAGSSAEFNAHLSESVLARVMITVRTTPGRIPPFDVRALETRLAAVARRWDDDLKAALVESVGEARGNEWFKEFGRAFPAGYREDFPARAAVADIVLMSQLSAAQPLAMSLYRPLEAGPGALRFKLFKLGGPVPLSESLPMLEHMGLKVLDERPHRVSPDGMPPVWMHDLGMIAPGADTEVEIDSLHEVFESAFAQIFRGEVENDDFNRLVVAARLPAEEIVILRACAKYMRQIGFALSQAFIQAHARGARRHRSRSWSSCSRCASILKAARVPGRAPPSRCAPSRRRSKQVENLSEDRVLRQYLALIQAMTRTNYWRRDDQKICGRSFHSSSIRRKLPGLPEPRPMFEIFVYSTRFEGVHLRGGKVARGGLRWSDRREDFRTEVLGPGEGADGEEHRDRSRGLEGRLRAQARAGGRATARRS